jgi:hypothetical protein
MKNTFFILVLFCLLISCEAIFVEDISNRKVVLLAPTNNAVLDSGTIHFNWTPMKEIEGYQIQIATPNFLSASQLLLDSISTHTTITKSLEIGSYEWRVKATNSDYETPYSSSSFTVN